MKKSEFRVTQKGRKIEYLNRRTKNVWIDIEQEPGKNSLSDEEKRFFRGEVKKFLKKNNRRPFRKDIILEIQFYTTQANPPAIQTLTKKYLDLLHKSMPKIDSLDRILFNEDSQIKLLISNVDYDSTIPQIRIRAYRYSHFLKDIEFATQLSLISTNYEQNENRTINGFGFENNYDLYSELKENTDLMSIDGMEDFFETQKEIRQRQLQESYIKLHQINYEDLLRIFQNSFYKDYENLIDPKFKMILKKMEDFKSLSISSIPLGGAPIASGEKQIFKENEIKKLSEFKTKHKILFPLVYPIGITVFYSPPKINVQDLDNLAILIIPMLIKLFNPPTKMVSLEKSEENFPDIINSNKIRKRLPTNAITNYQIISLPRNDDTPDIGKIDLFISDGINFYNNLWNQIDSIIDRTRYF